MAKIVPMVQLAAHAKSSTLYGRTVVLSYNQIFSAWWVTTISYNYGATLELRYNRDGCGPPFNSDPADILNNSLNTTIE